MLCTTYSLRVQGKGSCVQVHTKRAREQMIKQMGQKVNSKWFGGKGCFLCYFIFAVSCKFEITSK